MSVEVVEDLAFCAFGEDGPAACFKLSTDDGPRRTDLDVLREVWIEDVYHLREMDLDGKVVLDIGAHMGALSVLAAKLGAGVVAVEVNPFQAGRIAKHCGMNEVGIDIRITAVGPFIGDALYVADEETGMAHVDFADHHLVEGTERGDPTTMVTIDDLISSLDFIELLKVDIEGDEFPAMMLLPEEVMERVTFVAMEFHSTTPSTVGALIGQLMRTHSVQAFGHPTVGGMIHARRYGS